MSRVSQAGGPPSEKRLSLLQEFREFALRGNLIDLAVAVVIGTAFAKVIDSLVKNIIMPLISLVMPSNQNYLNWTVTVGNKVIPYGLFIGDVVSFLIIAFAIFLVVVKFLNWLATMRRPKEEAAAPLTKDQELLSEIRDLLKEEHAVVQ